MEHNRVDRESAMGPKHDNEEHGIATAFCEDCAEFYCDTCVALHKRFGATRGHQLKPATDIDRTTALAINAQKRNLKCGEHSDTKLEFYCDECHIPICNACCTLTHKGHQHRGMAAVGKEYQKKLEEFIQAAEGQVKKVQGWLKTLKESPQSIQQDTNKARQEVKQAAKEIRDLCNQERAVSAARDTGH